MLISNSHVLVLTRNAILFLGETPSCLTNHGERRIDRADAEAHEKATRHPANPLLRPCVHSSRILAPDPIRGRRIQCAQEWRESPLDAHGRKGYVDYEQVFYCQFIHRVEPVRFRLPLHRAADGCNRCFPYEGEFIHKNSS